VIETTLEDPKKYLFSSLACAVIFGSLIAISIQTLETNNNNDVKEFGDGTTHAITEIDGAYSITYLTTGPIFTRSNLGCSPSPEFYGFFPEHMCLILNYDGKPGKVELRIPNEVIKEFPSIGEVRLSVFRSIPSEIVSQDDLFTVIRIDLPAGYYHIELIGEKTSHMTNFIVLAIVFGLIIFFPTLYLFALFSKWIKTIQNKRSRKWYDPVNEETRENIRKLYLNYVGAHSIAKELNLDVGIVRDILRGYGIQGREF
jgi:hypothetical protein